MLNASTKISTSYGYCNCQNEGFISKFVFQSPAALLQTDSQTEGTWNTHFKMQLFWHQQYSHEVEILVKAFNIIRKHYDNFSYDLIDFWPLETVFLGIRFVSQVAGTLNTNVEVKLLFWQLQYQQEAETLGDTFEIIIECDDRFSCNSIYFWLLDSVLLGFCLFGGQFWCFPTKITFSKKAVILTVKVEILN